MSTKKLQILGSVVDTDTTLTKSGVPADAQIVGNEIEQIRGLVGDTNVSSQITEAIEDIIEVPPSTADDNGKFLRVVNGVATWESVPSAEEATF